MRSVMSVGLLAAALMCPCLPDGDDSQAVAAADQNDARSNRVTFYSVPLTCPAARGLGCGSAAKPILLDLERTSMIDEAWLDQSGTTMAVVWAHDSATHDRKTALSAITEARGLSIEELTGDANASAAAGFASGKGWHRGTDVDTLSAEEAQVITDRLLGRFAAKAPTAKAKTAALRPEMIETIRQLLVGECQSIAECREKVLTLARRHLTARELTTFTEAVDAGYRPIGNERQRPLPPSAAFISPPREGRRRPDTPRLTHRPTRDRTGSHSHRGSA
jgi:hypothetical protein